MRKYTCSLKIVILTVFLLVSCQSYVYGADGYYPVYDDRTEEDIKNNNHPSYKEWCEQTFDLGAYVYEAYKGIAFNIKHAPELPKIDIWQTPIQTSKLKAGDCEDAIIWALDGLALSQRNAGIVWGWVTNKKTNIATAHVWCELTARDGEKYVMESFSEDWNGIIPMKEIEKFERRKPTFKLSCIEFNHLANSYHGWNIRVDYKELLVVEGDYITYGDGYMTNDIILHQTLDDSTKVYDRAEVSKILVKLHKLFSKIHKGE